MASTAKYSPVAQSEGGKAHTPESGMKKNLPWIIILVLLLGGAYMVCPSKLTEYRTVLQNCLPCLHRLAYSLIH